MVRFMQDIVPRIVPERVRRRLLAERHRSLSVLVVSGVLCVGSVASMTVGMYYGSVAAGVGGAVSGLVGLFLLNAE